MEKKDKTDYAAAYRQYCTYGRGRSIKQFCEEEDFNYTKFRRYVGKCPKFEVIANLEVESVVNTFAVIIHLKLSHYGNDRLRKRV